MKQKIILSVLLLVALFMFGCTDGVKPVANGGTEISSGGASCTLYIIEKDGYRFAVAVGPYKCAITQIK